MSSSDPYETPDFLIRDFQKDRSKGEEEQFYFSLKTFIDSLSKQDERVGERAEDIAKSDVEHPIFEALASLKMWYFEENFKSGAMNAKEKLSEAADCFSNKGWKLTSYICVLQNAKLLSRVPGQEPEAKICEALDYILKEGEVLSHPSSINPLTQINAGNVYPLLELVIDSDEQISEDMQLRALNLASLGASKSGQGGGGMTERNWLDYYINIAKILNRKHDVLSGYVRVLESYESAVKSTKQFALKASYLHDALLDTQEILTAKEQGELTGRIQSYEQKAVEGGEYVAREETIERDQLQGVIDLFHNRFEETRSQISAQAALWRSSLWNEFFPSHHHITEAEPRITDIVSQRLTDSQYNPISVTEGGIDNMGEQVPVAYSAELQLNDQILSECLRSKIKDGKLMKEDLYGVIQSLPGSTQDDVKFLQAAVDCYFDHRYESCYIISITRLEGVVKRALQSRGEVTNALKPDDSIEQRGLAGLIDGILVERDPPLAYYLKYKYANKQGQNLRNRAAHSQLFYAEMTPLNSILALYDTLRAGIRIKHIFQSR